MGEKYFSSILAELPSQRTAHRTKQRTTTQGPLAHDAGLRKCFTFKGEVLLIAGALMMLGPMSVCCLGFGLSGAGILYLASILTDMSTEDLTRFVDPPGLHA